MYAALSYSCMRAEVLSYRISAGIDSGLAWAIVQGLDSTCAVSAPIGLPCVLCISDFPKVFFQYIVQYTTRTQRQLDVVKLFFKIFFTT